MSTVQEIKRAMDRLSPAQREKVRTYLTELAEREEDRLALTAVRKARATTKTEDYLPWEEVERRFDAVHGYRAPKS